MTTPKGKVGRPRRSTRLADQPLTIRLTEKEHNLLERAAGDLPVSAWARQTLLAAAHAAEIKPV